jgi:flagellar biosynthetic protein FlhB
MAFEDTERTEAATPRRRQEARERGQVARSGEVNSALVLLGTFGALAFWGATIGNTLVDTFRQGLSLGGRSDLRVETIRGLFLWAASLVGHAIFPVVLSSLALGLLANVVQVGFLVTPQALGFHWDRIRPSRGLKNLCSSRGAVELLKAFVKLFVLGIVAYRTLRPEWARLPELAQMDLGEALAWQLRLGLRLGLRVAGAHCLIALADYAYQRWQHERGLRMTRSEILEEGRQQEGSPQIRARVRSLQRERGMRRMMQGVPSASVVVVNPVHIAVALRYEAKTMRAPRVVAKGKRLVAARIVAIARQSGVPVVQDIPLARALDKLVEVGAEIPTALYRAVAAVLAYIYAQDPRRARA